MLLLRVVNLSRVRAVGSQENDVTKVVFDVVCPTHSLAS